MQLKIQRSQKCALHTHCDVNACQTPLLCKLHQFYVAHKISKLLLNQRLFNRYAQNGLLKLIFGLTSVFNECCASVENKREPFKHSCFCTNENHKHSWRAIWLMNDEKIAYWLNWLGTSWMCCWMCGKVCASAHVWIRRYFFCCCGDPMQACVGILRYFLMGYIQL